MGFSGVENSIFEVFPKQQFIVNSNFQEVFHNLFHTLWKTFSSLSTLFITPRFLTDYLLILFGLDILPVEVIVTSASF